MAPAQAGWEVNSQGSVVLELVASAHYAQFVNSVVSSPWTIIGFGLAVMPDKGPARIWQAVKDREIRTLT